MQAQKKQINMSALLGPGPEKLTGFFIGEYRALEGKVEANGNVTKRARSMELLTAGSLVPLITASTTTTFSNSASISIVIAAPAFRRAVSPHSATVQAIIATLVNMPSLSPAFDAGSPLFYLPCRSPAASMAAPGGLQGMKRRCKEENFRFKSARKERGRKIKQENQTLKEANAKVNAAKSWKTTGYQSNTKTGSIQPSGLRLFKQRLQKRSVSGRSM